MTNDYEIGKGKPPQKHQFKPGKSGNPKGRPKKLTSDTIAGMYWELLSKEVAVIENGRKTKIPLAQAVMQQQLNLAAKGDSKANNYIMKTLEKRINKEPEIVERVLVIKAGCIKGYDTPEEYDTAMREGTHEQYIAQQEHELELEFQKIMESDEFQAQLKSVGKEDGHN